MHPLAALLLLVVVLVVVPLIKAASAEHGWLVWMLILAVTAAVSITLSCCKG
jgi:hypothetical protein